MLQDLSKNGKDGLDFAAALELLLNMRGGNAATVPQRQTAKGEARFQASGVEVKDVKEQLRLTKSLVKSTQWRLVQKLARVCTCHAESTSQGP